LAIFTLLTTMKFSREALLFLSTVTISFSSFTEAFVSWDGRTTTFLSNRWSHSYVTWAATNFGPTPTRTKHSRLRMIEDDVDDDEEDFDEDAAEPLSKGVRSVSWLPTVANAKGDGVPELTRKDSEILPLFPLGGIVYTPNSEHILNIFEPRYSQMYNDILMNGTKRFVVSMSHPSESGRFAQTGVLFELEDLKEVSEQTADQIKYICNHKVTGRVKLHRVLNPEAWQSRDTYLRVEGTITDDSVKEGESASSSIYGVVGNAKEEKALKSAFSDLIEIQHELEEDVRFTRASGMTLSVKPGSGEDGLWQTIRLWQSFADQRLMARQNELQRDFQEKLQAFLKKERGLTEEELPSAIGFDDLSPALQVEVQELQKRMAIELRPLVLESTLTMQKVLEAENHTERLQLVRHFVEAETRRLTTKKTLRGVFSGSSMGTGEGSDQSEKRLTESKRKNENSSKPSSIFTDEDDAFQ
jgi:hypothetical protein